MKKLIATTSCIMIFIFSVNAQTIIKSGNKYGIADVNGEIVFEASLDGVKQGTHKYWQNVFILKKAGKFAVSIRKEYFTRYVTGNSTILYSDDKIDSLRWETTGFDFDSVYVIDAFEDHRSHSYAQYAWQGRTCTETNKYVYVMGYAKNGKMGVITIDRFIRKYDPAAKSSREAYNLNYAYENLLVRPPVFDAMLFGVIKTSRDGFDAVITTRANNRFGIIDLQSHFEVKPTYDSIPVFEKVRSIKINSDYAGYAKYYVVKERGKEGILELNTYKDEAKLIVPCSYTKIKLISENNAVSAKSGEPMIFFDLETGESYMPVNEDKSLLVNDPGTWYNYQTDFLPGYKVMLKARGRNYDHANEWRAYNEVYVIDISKKTTKAYSESGNVYMLIMSPQNALVIKYTPSIKSGKREYTFIDAETGNVNSTVQVDATANIGYDDYSQPGLYTHFTEISMENKEGKKKTLGYYDHKKMVFSKKKPRPE